jgi:hypothetical protein
MSHSIRFSLLARSHLPIARARPTITMSPDFPGHWPPINNSSIFVLVKRHARDLIDRVPSQRGLHHAAFL